MCALFFPWVGGQWYGTEQQWTGFGFHTGYNGHVVFLLYVFLLAMTLSPMVGGPVLVRKAHRQYARLLIAAFSTALLLSSFTVLLRLTSEVSGADIRFGIYVSIVSSAIVTLYAFLNYQEEVKSRAQAMFQHPDESALKPKPAPEPEILEAERPPMPPPPPLQPEDHQISASRA